MPISIIETTLVPPFAGCIYEIPFVVFRIEFHHLISFWRISCQKTVRLPTTFRFSFHGISWKDTPAQAILLVQIFD